MVKKVFLLFSREITGLHQAAAVLAFFTFLSQLLGLVRDRLLAHTFGAGSTLDIYYAAFRIPDLVLVLLASVVSLAILVPFLTEKLEQGTRGARRFLNSIATVFAFGIIAVSVFLFIVMPLIAEIFFPGFATPLEQENFVNLTRILLLSPIFLGFSNLLSSIVQVKRRFVMYSLSPVLYNVGIIAGILLLYPLLGLLGLGLGVILGALMHLLVQLPTVIKVGLAPYFTWRIEWNDIKTVVLTSLPRAFTLSTNQIIFLLFTGIATTLAAGSVTVLNFALNLQSVPLALIGVSYSLAAFPALSRFWAEGNRSKFVENLGTALRHIVFWSMPALVLFIVLRAHLVRVVLGSGAFDWNDTRLTAAALALFILSLAAQSVTLLLVRAYYAAGNTKTPLLISLISALTSIVLGFLGVVVLREVEVVRYFLESLLRVDDIGGTLVLALPFAYSAGSLLNTMLLWRHSSRSFGLFGGRIRKALFHSLCAAIIMGAFMRFFQDLLAPVVALESVFGVFAQGMVMGLVGLLVFLITLSLMRNRELEEFQDALRKRFWSVDILPEEQKEL